MRNLVHILHQKLVINKRVPASSPFSDDVLEIALKLRDMSRNSIIVKNTAMVDLEQLIEILAAIEDYYGELEYYITLAIHNILLQNRALCLQICMEDDIQYLDILIGEIFKSCAFFIDKRLPELKVLEARITPLDYYAFADGQIDFLHTVQEREYSVPKMSIFFLLCSVKIPKHLITYFMTNHFIKYGFVFDLYILDLVGKTAQHNSHQCDIIKSQASLFVQVWRVWYAFTCNYEDEIWDIAVDQGWEAIIVLRWQFVFDQIRILVPFAIKYLLEGTFFTNGRNSLRSTMSLANVLLIPRWEMYRDWLFLHGVNTLNDPVVISLVLCNRNMKLTNFDQLYMKSHESFQYVNLEVLPLFSVINKLLGISIKYDEETNGEKPNFVKNILRYALGGQAANQNGTPDELGISPELVDLIPDLKPHLIKFLQEPLMIKVNKEILQILNRLDLDLEIPRETPHFLDMRANSGIWNLTGLKINGGNIDVNQPQLEDETEKENEANNILDLLEKLA